jgi:hypothetical protein
MGRSVDGAAESLEAIKRLAAVGLLKDLAEGALDAARAVVEWADSLVEVEEQLRKQGQQVDELNVANGQWQASTAQLDQALLELSATVGTDLLPELSKLADSLTDLLLLVRDYWKEIKTAGEYTMLFVRAVAAVSTGGMSEVLRAGFQAGGASEMLFGAGGVGSSAPGINDFIGPLQTGGGGAPLTSTATAPRIPGYSTSTIPGFVASFDPASLSGLEQLSSTLGDAAIAWEDALAGLQGVATRLGSSQGGIVAAGGAAAMFDGSIGSVVSIAGGDPVSQAVLAIFQLLKNLPELVNSLIGQVLDIYTNLPDWIGNILETLPETLARLIPTLIVQFATMAPRIIIEALTLFFSPDFWLGIVGAFIDGLATALKGLLAPFNEVGGALGINLGKEAEVKRVFGIKLPFLDEGGIVQKTGMVVAHAGEEYLGAPGSRAARSNRGGSGVTVNIGQVVAPDPRRFTEELRRSLGSYGLGLSLSPLGTS